MVETASVFASLLVSLVVLFVPITVAIVLVQRWLGDERLTHLLGDSRLPVALLKGTLLGALTPFCGCSTVPLLLGLLRARVRFAAVAAFMLASPLLNPYILGVVALLFGARVAVGYAAFALVTSMALAAAWEAVGLDRHLRTHLAPRIPAVTRPDVATVGASAQLLTTGRPVAAIELDGNGASCGDDGGRSCGTAAGGGGTSGAVAWRGLRTEARLATHEAMGVLRPMVRPVLLGVGIGALVYGVVPDGWFASLLGTSTWWSLPLAAALGLPLYLRGEAAFPIGAGLLAAGVGTGPMFAMVIAGMGASLPEVTILSGIFRPKLLAAFLGSVFLTAILGGALLPQL